MEFYQILILIIVGIIAVRFTFKFDLNQYLKSRREIKINQLKNICPHGHIIKENKGLIFESYFSSPFGTTKYICSQCGCIVNSEFEVNRYTEFYLNKPELVLKKQKEFIKKAKKLKLI